MKKILFGLFSIAMFSFSSCIKVNFEETINNTTGGGTVA